MRDALLVLGSTMPDFRKAFGSRQNVDPVRHLVGTATGWGGNPDKDAIYLNVMPEKNNGVTIHKLKVKDVPVNAFWSVSVYNAKGYYEKNSLNAYTINNITAKTDADSSVAIQFGGCDGKIRTACPSRRAGTTRCASTGRSRKFSVANGSSLSRRRREREHDDAATQRRLVEPLVQFQIEL